MTCPECGVGDLRLSSGLVANGRGGPLRGAAVKLTRQTQAVIECPECNTYAVGRVQGARYDRARGEFIGGEFVPDYVVPRRRV